MRSPPPYNLTERKERVDARLWDDMCRVTQCAGVSPWQPEYQISSRLHFGELFRQIACVRFLLVLWNTKAREISSQYDQQVMIICKTPFCMRQGGSSSIATETQSIIPNDQYKTKATGIIIIIILRVYASLLLFVYAGSSTLPCQSVGHCVVVLD